jgi:hypothetical protein
LPGAATCDVGTSVCDQFRFAGAGAALDAWIPGQAVAHRLTGASPAWRTTAGGPGLDTSVSTTWAGGLGITTRFDPKTGSDTGELVVWRPV